MNTSYRWIKHYHCIWYDDTYC